MPNSEVSKSARIPNWGERGIVPFKRAQRGRLTPEQASPEEREFAALIKPVLEGIYDWGTRKREKPESGESNRVLIVPEIKEVEALVLLEEGPGLRLVDWEGRLKLPKGHQRVDIRVTEEGGLKMELTSLSGGRERRSELGAPRKRKSIRNFLIDEPEGLLKAKGLVLKLEKKSIYPGWWEEVTQEPLGNLTLLEFIESKPELVKKAGPVAFQEAVDALLGPGDRVYLQDNGLLVITQAGQENFWPDFEEIEPGSYLLTNGSLRLKVDLKEDQSEVERLSLGIPEPGTDDYWEADLSKLKASSPVLTVKNPLAEEMAVITDNYQGLGIKLSAGLTWDEAEVNYKYEKDIVLSEFIVHRLKKTAGVVPISGRNGEEGELWFSKIPGKRCLVRVKSSSSSMRDFSFSFCAPVDFSRTRLVTDLFLTSPEARNPFFSLKKG